MRLRIRQRPQQDRVDDTKDRGVRSNAECQREDRDDAEAGRFAQLAKGEADVIHSERRVTIGSVRDARRAGIQQAAAAATARSKPTTK